jgi:hypothetical protein
MTDAYDRWSRTPVRTPRDIPIAAPLSWLTERHQHHTRRLADADIRQRHGLTAPAAPHPAADAVAALALGQAIRSRIGATRALEIRDALTSGATWAQVAAALETTPDHARDHVRRWAAGQARLHADDTAQGLPRPLGIDAEQHAAVLALVALGDHESAPGADL